MVETLRITITIAGKRFSLTVPRKDEEIYRKAADQLSKKIEEYTRRAPDADESYIVAQAAFYMSLRLQVLNEAHSQDMKAIAEICEDIENIISSQE
ncbi:MAG: cell division protein ZapA [Bacteroidales bacterium]|nr:cell division protein ZapA [Bacteroidales bacterium]MBR5532214.1 cell division protein ZapA [Bacteroidales bacterium]